MKYGFTLIELLIVVAIIGILAAIAVPNFLNAQQRAKISKVVSELRSVKDAYTMYFMDQNGWPPHLDASTAQHKYVTTPIAYLNTSIWDPFLNSREGQTKPHFYWFGGQYHAEPSYFWNTKQWNRVFQLDPVFASEITKSSFVVISVGPNLLLEANTNDAHRFDMSNGLMSMGDIMTTIPGDFKQGYPYTENNYPGL